MKSEFSLDLVNKPGLVAVYEGDRQLENGREYVRVGNQLKVTTDCPDAITVKPLDWQPKSDHRGPITQEANAALSPSDRQHYKDGEI